jgi:hypothetical protein
MKMNAENPLVLKIAQSLNKMSGLTLLNQRQLKIWLNNLVELLDLLQTNLIFMETRPIITEAEELFMHYKNGMAGGGMTALIEAIWRLDAPNRAKIALGFPEIVEVCNRFNNEIGYWENLQKRWKESHQLINIDL